MSPYRGDGDGEPNEILRHTLTEFPGVNKAVIEEDNVVGRSLGLHPSTLSFVSASAYERSLPRNTHALKKGSIVFG